ncbi:MAG: RICIN domain-containing protein, partial [Lachnospiraceae bacterium]|nr:RICIN domain-containing protein [Lachnospiraceae bacterium]
MVNNTKVYITDRSSSEAMKFRAIKNADGTWKFINAKCDLALAVQQNSPEVGKGLVLYRQTTKEAQNWKLARKSDNSFAIMNAVTGYSVAMSDPSAVKGTTLSMAESATSGLQRFYVVETDPVNNQYDGTYVVRASSNNAYALNIASSSKEDGANVNLYKYSNTGARKFEIAYSGGGYYRLINVNSGLVVTVKGNTKANGTNVIQSAWAAESGQRWKISVNADGTVTFTNALGTALHLVSNSVKNNSNIVARNAMTTKAQMWYLDRVA